MRTLKILGIIVLFIAPFYALNVYNSFFGEEPGYIYDPSTDQLYWLTLKPSIYRHEHWKRHLLPFGSPDFRDILAVRRHRTLTKELAEQNKLADIEGIKDYLEGLKRGELPHAGDTSEFELISAEYWARYDLNPTSLLPWQWKRLSDGLMQTKGEGVPADVVLVRRDPNKSGLLNIEVLRGVLFLGPKPARIINSYCFFPTPDQWKECTSQGRNAAQTVAPADAHEATRR